MRNFSTEVSAAPVIGPFVSPDCMTSRKGSSRATASMSWAAVWKKVEKQYQNATRQLRGSGYSLDASENGTGLTCGGGKAGSQLIKADHERTLLVD